MESGWPAFHGGMCNTLRSFTEYQFMCGDDCTPSNIINYGVNVVRRRWPSGTRVSVRANTYTSRSVERDTGNHDPSPVNTQTDRGRCDAGGWKRMHHMLLAGTRVRAFKRPQIQYHSAAQNVGQSLVHTASRTLLPHMHINIRPPARPVVNLSCVRFSWHDASGGDMEHRGVVACCLRGERVFLRGPEVGSGRSPHFSAFCGR